MQQWGWRRSGARSASTPLVRERGTASARRWVAGGHFVVRFAVGGRAAFSNSIGGGPRKHGVCLRCGLALHRTSFCLLPCLLCLQLAKMNYSATLATLLGRFHFRLAPQVGMLLLPVHLA